MMQMFSLARIRLWLDHKTEKLGPAQMVEVVSISKPTLEPQKREDVIAFQMDAAKLRDAVRAASSSLESALETMTVIRSAIKSSPKGTPELGAAAAKLELQLKQTAQKLSGESIRGSKYEQTVPAISNRIRSALSGSMGNTYGITQTQREQVAIAKNEFSEAVDEIRELLEIDVKLFEQRLDDAGIPWTPGRSIPEFDK